MIVMSEANTENKQNPANDPKVELQRQRPPRIPMSSQRRRLQVADMPGWHLHWFKEENIPDAMQAYYEFVHRGEVSLNQSGVANRSVEDGNTDLGTNVSIVAGKHEDGSPQRLVLMKIREEYFLEDQRDLMKRNAQILEAIFGDEAAEVGRSGEISARPDHTYVDQKRTSLSLFNRPVRKAKIRAR